MLDGAIRATSQRRGHEKKSSCTRLLDRNWTGRVGKEFIWHGMEHRRPMGSAASILEHVRSTARRLARPVPR
eukprot:SAG22_NODE_385_length_11304_cov_21.304775_3_plen_72_part_00